MKIILISILLISSLIAGCQNRPTLDLAKLTLTEKATALINYEDRYKGGVNTMDAARAFALQASHSRSFSFNGQPLDTVGIVFLMRSDQIRKDTSLYQGGATINQEPVTSETDLQRVTRKYQAADHIYGYQLRIKKEAQQDLVLKELIKLYGPATKNPHTEKGLYWNLKSKQKLVLFNPEYENLLVVNYSGLSHSCFADFSTGLIDMGGCDLKQYVAELSK
jgi:hypothetical protein